jgi:hypothetical protein
VTRYLAAGAARRVTTIGRLRAAGFRVVHSATSADGERQLFWRLTGYVPRSMSIWLYVPLTVADESRLAYAEPSDLLKLSGLVFQSRDPRYVTVGVARDYRLVFEREWHLPDNADARTLLADLLAFLRDALRIALAEDMPPARHEIVYATSEAIRELATASA